MIFRFILSVTLLLFFCTNTNATQTKFDLELNHTNLPDAIRLLAKFLHLNVLVSPAIQGTATLSIHEASPAEALDLLLMSNGLARLQVGPISLIAPQEELIKRQQNRMKWQEVAEEASPLGNEVWLIHFAKAEDIFHIIQDEHNSMLSKRGRMRVDTRTNVIWARDIPARLRSLQQIIVRLDTPVQQIAIEARLASVDYDCEQELGVSFGVSTAETGSPNQKRKVSIPQPGRYSLAIAKLADGSLLDVKLAALESAGHAELISSPSLFASNQQVASIESGEEVPYQQLSESGGTAVVFKKAVLGLKVTPQILPGNRVLLQLQINQDRPSSKMVLGMPTISTRQITTSVLVRNGQTIVLGGIYETNKESGQQGLPFLNRLPWVGLLFKQQNTRENKRELLVFVTPKIMT